MILEDLLTTQSVHRTQTFFWGAPENRRQNTYLPTFSIEKITKSTLNDGISHTKTLVLIYWITFPQKIYKNHLNFCIDLSYNPLRIENFEIKRDELRENFIFDRSLSQINFALEIEILMTLEGAFSKSKMESSFFLIDKTPKLNVSRVQILNE